MNVETKGGIFITIHSKLHAFNLFIHCIFLERISLHRLFHRMSVRSVCLAAIPLLVLLSCENPGTSSSADQSQLTNTLGEPSVGNGMEGSLQDYFYNFESDINVDFYRYGNTRFDFSYGEFLALFNREPDHLTFKTFPDYLLDITAADTNSTVTQRVLVDSLTQLNVVREDSVTLFTSQFKNIEFMSWETDAEPELQRYKPNNSDWIFSDTTINYTDTLDWIVYAAVQDTVNPVGLTFVDRSEWVDTTYYPTDPRQKTYTKTFHFIRKIIGPDSLMYKVDTDCNGNGQWDDAETVDQGNGLWDPEEPYYDIDGDGSYDLSEPYRDCNCNGQWDPAEEFVDANGNGKWDAGESFTDAGNGKIDPAEGFTDLNQDGVAQPNELFIQQEIPNQLLVSYDQYPDRSSYRVLSTIYPGDSLIDRHGVLYHNILAAVQDSETVSRPVDDVDTLITLYTNRVIEHLDQPVNVSDYFITKTEWEGIDPATGASFRDYDYLLFKQDDNLYQLVHPSYFKPPGFQGFDFSSWDNGNWSSEDFAAGFWFENHPVEEVLYYTPNGMLRDGERVETDTTVHTPVATYLIHRSFAVDADEVTVPAKLITGYINAQGNKTCYADTTMMVSDYDECPAMDTTFTDCFRITREMRMTMEGNAVEYGERDLTWLVKGFGIVRDEVYVRWSEAPGSEEQWFGYSKWELHRYHNGGSRSGGMLGRVLAPARTVKLSRLQDEPELGADPYQVTRTAGLQRIGKAAGK
ncbi:MAG: hypothetical protein D6762_04060 [Candidatus Neomarinimicrobiota bacterium]|nr:MAG: hypothetical protein D6762_04060 [Candidatus Neomarinimicrobiota bacterium]